MARLLSSIPLVRHGFPPVCISPGLRGVYYESMNTVSVHLFKVWDSVDARPPRTSYLEAGLGRRLPAPDQLRRREHQSVADGRRTDHGVTASSESASASSSVPFHLTFGILILSLFLSCFPGSPTFLLLSTTTGDYVDVLYYILVLG